ncbi:hypothetical protein VPH35_067261 [Triticum aestivum]
MASPKLQFQAPSFTHAASVPGLPSGLAVSGCWKNFEIGEASGAAPCLQRHSNLSPLEEVLAAASASGQNHGLGCESATAAWHASTEAVFSSFGDLGMSMSGNHQRWQPCDRSGQLQELGSPTVQRQRELGRNPLHLPVAPASWDRATTAAASLQAKFNNGGGQVHPVNSWEAYVARTPAIDFSALQGTPLKICLGSGAQLGPDLSDRSTQEDGLSGGDLVNAIVSRVSSLPSDLQQRFVARVAALLSPSLLGVPSTEPAGGQTKRKLFASRTKIPKSSRQAVAGHSFMTSRKSQAQFCVRLGLIKNVKEFNDDTLKLYLSFFKNPVPQPLLAKLAEVAR